MKKIHKTFRLNENLIDFLEKKAKQENRSLANLVETILFNYLNKKFINGQSAAKFPK
jgi:hypothetical protein